MNEKALPAPLDQQLSRHPLIRLLGDMASELTGLQLLLVYPNASGWGQTRAGGGVEAKTAFCRLIQSRQDGVKHCRMCHILMAVAACSGGSVEQRCHAGATAMVSPASGPSSEAVAVISSCTFGSQDGWSDARALGVRLGIKPAELRKAFLTLPKMDKERRRLAAWIMQAMSAAVQAVRRQAELEDQVRELGRGSRTAAALEELLKNTRWVVPAPEGKAERGKAPPVLVQVVCQLIQQRPDLPLTVKEVAAAARLTPNHFTSLFRRHTGQIFTEYLAEQRIALAKQMLGDLTLSIAEIAQRVGYDDAGYFARRFRQKTGKSPREWREGRQTPQAHRERGASSNQS